MLQFLCEKQKQLKQNLNPAFEDYYFSLNHVCKKNHSHPYPVLTFFPPFPSVHLPNC